MSSSPSSGKCRLAEIIQYSCDEEIVRGNYTYHCWPIVRIFRLCPGRPAVELTRFVNVESSTGAIEVPSTSSEMLPKGKPWRDVVHHNSKNSET
ncbi:unnamed protein product [Somion occarium]|uniref:Uncharacterized protein n=1 Tax=Somion occarium TaxID=3059160 RepID=A0ABP1DQX8_9APHY